MLRDLWGTAVARDLISSEQAQTLRELEEELKGASTFRLSLTHLLWAAGTALILTALVLFVIEFGADDSLKVAWLLTAYAAGFALFARLIASKRDVPRILWGCLGAAAVILFSASAFAFHNALIYASNLDWLGPFSVGSPPIGLGWPSKWEALIASGLSFSLFSLAIATWYLKRSGFLPIWTVIALSGFAALFELYRLLFPTAELNEMQLESSALTFGFFMLALSFLQDRKSRMNHGFWVNKAAWICISLGMTGLYQWGGKWEFFVALFYILAALYSVYIRRPGGVSFAAVGLFGFLSENVWEFFPNIWGGILMCTVAGIGLILIGLIIFRWQDKLDSFVPQAMQDMRPTARKDPVTFGF